MRAWKSWIAGGLAAFIAMAGAAQAQDVAGSSDHPLVGRFQGSVLTFYETRSYEERRLPSAPIQRGEHTQPDLWQTPVEGKLTSIRYEGPGDRSALEVVRNFQRHLEGQGFEIVFDCRGQEGCAPGGALPTFWEAARGPVQIPQAWDSSVYVFAKRQAEGQLVFASIYGVEQTARGSTPLTPFVAVNVLESQAMETGLVTFVEASEMEEALATDGRIAIYRIEFDFDSADIRPQSAEQIAELGSMLTGSPELKVLIVGHTDGQGAFDYNLLLSQRRAQAVVDALATTHGVARERLTPAGAGMVSPVATNRTDDGRARNRRVEIVEMIQ